MSRISRRIGIYRRSADSVPPSEPGPAYVTGPRTVTGVCSGARRARRRAARSRPRSRAAEHDAPLERDQQADLAAGDHQHPGPQQPARTEAERDRVVRRDQDRRREADERAQRRARRRPGSPAVGSGSATHIHRCSAGTISSAANGFETQIAIAITHISAGTTGPAAPSRSASTRSARTAARGAQPPPQREPADDHAAASRTSSAMSPACSETVPGPTAAGGAPRESPTSFAPRRSQRRERERHRRAEHRQRRRDQRVAAAVARASPSIDAPSTGRISTSTSSRIAHSGHDLAVEQQIRGRRGNRPARCRAR